MKFQLLRSSTAAVTGFILTAPVACFIFIALLKHSFGLPALFDASEPLLDSLGAKQPLGWNINLLLLLGPLLTFLLNFSAIAYISFRRTEEGISFRLFLRRKIWNWIALFVSGGCLAALFFYALGEACHC